MKETPMPISKIDLITLGDGSVGKTSLIRSYMGKSFLQDHIMTHALTAESKIYKLKQTGADIKIQLWDTAGQEKLAQMVKSFYHKCDGILLCFDVTNSESFMSIDRWVKSIEDNAKEEVLIILVGNKYDMDPIDHKISKKEINSICTKHNFRFYETSAKIGMGIQQAVNQLAEMVYSRKVEALQKYQKKEDPRISLRQQAPDDEIKQKKKNCCK